ncbi:MAG: Holliday junction resolvase RuvX [Planctomycetaceae bacterium]
MNDSFESAAAPDADLRGLDADAGALTVPAEGRLLGLDYGTRRVGVAVCDDRQKIASPLETYYRRSDEADVRFLEELASEYRVVGIVVGLPVHMSGDEGGKAAEARSFGEWVSRSTSLPVAFWDERYTTSMAEDHLRAAGLSRDRRRELRDKIAAQMILQSFIESGDRTQSPRPLRG